MDSKWDENFGETFQRETGKKAGQEKFHALGPIYYREAHGALLVYDVTSPDSLRKVRDWIKELNKMLGSHKVRLAIVGNKMDLIKDPASWPLIQEAVAMAEELLNARHYLTSAKSNEGIGEMFVSLAKRMIEQQTLGGGPAGRASGPPGPRLLQLGVGGRGDMQQAALAERGPAGSSSAHYGSQEACAQRSQCSCL